MKHIIEQDKHQNYSQSTMKVADGDNYPPIPLTIKLKATHRYCPACQKMREKHLFGKLELNNRLGVSTRICYLCLCKPKMTPEKCKIIICGYYKRKLVHLGLPVPPNDIIEKRFETGIPTWDYQESTINKENPPG